MNSDSTQPPRAGAPPGSAPSLLILGGAGFVGSHLADAWLARGGKVVAFDDLSAGSLENLEAATGQPGFEWLQASVLEERELRAAIQAVDLVVNLASVVGVRRVLEDPLRTFLVAARGGRLVARLCAELDRPLLSISSSEVYGPDLTPPFREDARPADLRAWGERGVYARSKRIGERAALSSLGPKRAAVVRLFNVSGPRQRADSGMVLPRFVAQALAGEPLELYGDGQQTRTFCHVADAVRGLCLLLEGLLEPEGCPRAIFNLGGSDEHRLCDVAERVLKLSGSRSGWVHSSLASLGWHRGQDPQRRRPDLERIRSTLGWSPARSLDALILDLLADRRGG